MTDFNDFVILACTIWGEARGEPATGKAAVAWTVINRFRSARWFAGASIAATCLKSRQYSCWNEDDPNRAKLAAQSLDAPSKTFRECLNVALGVLLGEIPDPTGGAMHYHAASIAPPAWARGRTPAVSIGRHVFYKDVP